MSTKDTDDLKDDAIYRKYIPFYSWTDLDSPRTQYLLLLFRLFQAVYLTYNMNHPDEYWQSIEVAYDIVYGGVELPWEWSPHYRMRSTVYAYFLGFFLWVIKHLGIDFFIVVKLYPYLVQMLLVLVSDHYLWRIGKKTIGIPGTRIAFVFYLASRLYNEIIIRTFSNSIESIFQIIAFYYYLDVGSKLNRSVLIMTAFLTVSFVIRNTSPIGWVPLLLLKLRHSFLPFLLSGVLVFFPVIGLCTLLDSAYYGELTFTSYNFVKHNLGDGLSKYYGTDPFHYYVFAIMPLIFIVAYPGVMISLVIYPRDMLMNKHQ